MVIIIIIIIIIICSGKLCGGFIIFEQCCPCACDVVNCGADTVYSEVCALLAMKKKERERRLAAALVRSVLEGIILRRTDRVAIEPAAAQ